MIQRRQVLKSLLAASLFPATTRLAPPPSRARPLRIGASPIGSRCATSFPRGLTGRTSRAFCSCPIPSRSPKRSTISARSSTADAMWIEIAAFTDAEGRPFTAVKRALAEYIGGTPAEIAFTSNTTTGWRYLPRTPYPPRSGDRHHGSMPLFHHESIRYAARDSGWACATSRCSDTPSTHAPTRSSTASARALTPASRAVGVTWVQSSTGIKLPIAGIAEVVAGRIGIARRPIGPLDRRRCARICESGRRYRAAGGRLFRQRHAQVAVRAARHRVLMGQERCLARAAAHDSDFDPDGIDTTSTRGRTARSCRRRRPAFVSPGGLWHTSTCSPYRLRRNSTAPSAATGLPRVSRS